MEAKCREIEEETEKEKERDRMPVRKRAASNSKAFDLKQEERVVRKQHSDEKDDMKAFNMKQLELEKVRTDTLCVLCVRSCVLSDALNDDLGSRFQETLNAFITPTELCTYSHSLLVSTLPVL